MSILCSLALLDAQVEKVRNIAVLEDEPDIVQLMIVMSGFINHEIKNLKEFEDSKYAERKENNLTRPATCKTSKRL